MPKVTDEHREGRRRQILLAAMQCFGRNGLHSTSMADLIAESKLSAGAFYLYFRSKEELIEAVAAEVLGGVLERLDLLRSATEPPSPAALLDALLDRATSIAEPSPVQSLPLLLSVWSEGTRSPAVAALVETVMTALRTRITDIVDRWVAQGHDMPTTAGHLAPVLMAMVQGYLLQATIGAAPSTDEYRAAVAALLTSAGLG